MTSHNKTKKLRVFSKLDKKPIAQKGVQFSFEKVGVVSGMPNMEGDIVKKYVNGKLKEQKFVTREKLSQLVKSATKRVMTKKVVGGKIKKPVAYKKPQVVNIQMKSNTQELLIQQKNKELELAERQVIAQENMVKAAETGNNLDKGFLAIIGADVAFRIFDHL